MNSTRIQSIWQVLILLFFTVMLLVVSPAYVGAAVRFVVTGDTRGCTDERPINTVMLEELVQATLNEDADFIVITGDLVNGYTSAEALKSQLIQWRNIMEELKDAGKGVYPCRGNHDLNVDGQNDEEVKQVWDEVFKSWALPDDGPLGEKYITYSVSFNDEDVFIVVLDTYVNPHHINQTWLIRRLFGVLILVYDAYLWTEKNPSFLLYLLHFPLILLCPFRHIYIEQNHMSMLGSPFSQ